MFKPSTASSSGRHNPQRAAQDALGTDETDGWRENRILRVV
jgi:hypothetical protein